MGDEEVTERKRWGGGWELGPHTRFPSFWLLSY